MLKVYGRALAVLIGMFAGLVIGLPDAAASPVVLSLQATDFGDLDTTGGPVVSLSSPYDYAGTFTGTVLSMVFSRSDGGYVYLYQADNAGPSVLEILAVCPFYTIVEAGFLSGGEPAGLLAGGVVPAGASYDAALARPNVSFNYPSFMGGHVPAGSHTVALYLISPNAPTVGEGYVIDSGTAVVDIATTIPEPLTLGVVGLGLCLLWAGKRRHRT